VAEDIIDSHLSRHFRMDESLDERLVSAAKVLREQALTRLKQVALDAMTAPGEAREPDQQVGHNAALHRLAQWSLASLSAEHAELWHKALKDDAFCRPPSTERNNMWSEYLHRFRNLPQADLTRLLDLESRLISQIGKIEPDTTAPFDIDKSARLAKTEPANALAPWAPVAALSLLHSQPKKQVSRVVNCYAQHVAYRNAGSTDQALAAFRAGNAWTVSRTFGYSKAQLQESRSDRNGLPVVATWFGVQGTITMEIMLDTAGKPETASVVSRNLKVPGVAPTETPVAFLDLLDDAGLAYAMRQKPRAELAGSKVRFQMGWEITQ
jgi:hypothetical protein